MKKLNILVTNDDGISFAGIKILAEALTKIGQVTVIAPSHERSACGHSLTFHSPLKVKEFHHPKLKAYAVNGTPTDCVIMGLFHLLPERPDLVVSGINRGANMGYDITYSGTVSAGLEAVTHKVPGLAVSLAGADPNHYETAAACAVQLAQRLTDPNRTDAIKLPESVLLNVNVPDVPYEELKGFRFTKQGRSIYRQFVDKRVDPFHREYYWLYGKTPTGEIEENSDFAAVGEGFVSMTPLGLDLTSYNALKSLENN